MTEGAMYDNEPKLYTRGKFLSLREAIEILMDANERTPGTDHHPTARDRSTLYLMACWALGRVQASHLKIGDMGYDDPFVALRDTIKAELSNLKAHHNKP